MKTRKERGQHHIDSLLSGLGAGNVEKKKSGPVDLWAGKKPNSKIRHLVHPHRI
jgi:hypothetical protein